MPAGAEDGPGKEEIARPALDVRVGLAGNEKAGHLRIRSTACSRESLKLRPDTGAERAARWALEMDAQLAVMVDSGKEVRVPFSLTAFASSTRVFEETPAAYRNLRLGTGDLVRPWLLGAPSLDALYPFQRAGVDWLRERAGAILADDMGLGKTVQVIFALRLLFNEAAIRSVLVACPKSLLDVWEGELLRWAPELGVAVLSPPGRIRDQAWGAVVGRRHVLVTNYEQLREPVAALGASTLDLVVADEAHRLRNFGAHVTAGIDRLPRRRFWALSGTPLERDLEDLATLLSLVEPTRFAPSDSRLHPASLRSAARPYILRRNKEDVLDELPPVLDRTETVELTRGQAEAYGDAVSEYRRGGTPGAELALLTRLRSICDLHAESGESSKIDRIMERLAVVRGRAEKAVVFAHLLAPLHELERRLESKWGSGTTRCLVGAMQAEEREKAVREFRTDPDVLALVASSRVGGEGLTLVEANHVFLLDEWWNPSANDQARDRVVRIGQKRTVYVYRFCCRGTIEERLQEILDSKRELFEDAVGRLDADSALGMVLREVGIESLVSKPLER